MTLSLQIRPLHIRTVAKINERGEETNSIRLGLRSKGPGLPEVSEALSDN